MARAKLCDRCPNIEACKDAGSYCHGIHEKARQIGTGIALSINGFVENADWKLVGSTIGNGINTGIYFAASFVDTLNFSAIGTAISDGLNGFLQTVDWSVLGYTIGESVKGILDIIYAALRELDWQSLGDAVYEFLAGIGNISIPRLANGGITTGSTLANIGEAGREAVIPLERNTEWMDTFAETLAGKMGGTGGTIDLNVILDGNTVYRRMVQLDREFAGRTGRSQFGY